MHFNKELPTIQLTIKDNIRDVLGERLSNKALKYFNINTKTVKSSKIFIILYELSNDKLTDFANFCLKDEIINDVFINTLYNNPIYKSYIIVAKLPGVTDDEGMSAQKTLSDFLNVHIDTKVQHIFSQELYLIEEDLPNEVLKKIAEEILGNKLINHFEYGKSIDKLTYVPEVQISTDETVEAINLSLTDDELVKLSNKMLLSLNLSEMKAIQNYYKNPEVINERKKIGLSENPTDCEIEIFAQTWSEHCKHKEFNAIINFKNLENGENKTIDSLFKTYIKGSTEIIQGRLTKSGNDWLIKVFSDNAGVVKINDKSVFVWKVETHNSPSAIDPYGGAITGILGNNRDPMGTGIGGGRFLFNTNVLCFGSPYYDGELLTGQLHPKRVFEGVRNGIEDGGNKSGIPTVNGSIIFDDRYSGKPLVYCGTGAIMPLSYKGKNSWDKEISDGDHIIMAGGRVGKDGIHGATFSSIEINEHSPQSAVQIGSPITQKLLSDFLEKVTQMGLVKCCTDNGAGGLSSSIGELASISGGAIVNLEKVPLKYSGLKPWEIFLSESQERMTLVVEEKQLMELFKISEEMEVELSDIGLFTQTGYLDVCYKGKKIAYIELDFLHNGVPRKILEAEWSIPKLTEPKLPEKLDYNDILLKLMGSLNICSRETIIRQYDHEVKGKTIIKPLMGLDGKSPQDAAVMRIGFDSYEGVAISNGIIPRYGDINAYEMSAGSFDEAVRQIISVGGKLPDLTKKNDVFWSVNDNFCVPDSVYDKISNPDGNLKLGKLVMMCEALYDMATYFNIPMTSGKDSMKNDFKADGEKISVPPTILYSMVAKIDDVRNTVTTTFKAAGDLIYILGNTYRELGSSEFLRLFGELGKDVPKIRKEDAKVLYQKVMMANEKRLIHSSHDISDGGMIVSIVESAFGSGYGVEIELDKFNGLDINSILFSESHSRFIVSIKPNDRMLFESIMNDYANLIGKVTDSKNVIAYHKGNKIIDLNINVLQSVWEKGLEI